MIDIGTGALILIVLALLFDKREHILAWFNREVKNYIPEKFGTIKNEHKTLNSVVEALRSAGLETSRLILAVDFTRSNHQMGKRTFGGRSLHHIDPRCTEYSNIPEEEIVAVWAPKRGRRNSFSAGNSAYPELATTNPELSASAPPQLTADEEMYILNPYQQVIRIIGQTLKTFDDENKIYAFGFGDKKSTDETVRPFHPKKAACEGFDDVIRCYNAMIETVELSGPTSFVPTINEAIRVVRQSRKYTILLIITDGEISDPEATGQAIVRASQYPISIICVGVGDGPFDTMEVYDDELPEREFDNFQFVNFDKVINNPHVENKAATFAMEALMEIPEQYKAIKKLGLINKLV